MDRESISTSTESNVSKTTQQLLTVSALEEGSPSTARRLDRDYEATHPFTISREEDESRRGGLPSYTHRTPIKSALLVMGLHTKKLEKIDRTGIETKPLQYGRSFLSTAAQVLASSVPEHLRRNLLFALSILTERPEPPRIEEETANLLTPDELSRTSRNSTVRVMLQDQRRQEQVEQFTNHASDVKVLETVVASLLADSVDKEAKAMLERVGCEDGRPWAEVVILGDPRAVWRAILQVYNQEHLRTGDSAHFHIEEYGKWVYNSSATFVSNWDTIEALHSNAAHSCITLGRAPIPIKDAVERLFRNMTSPFAAARLALAAGNAPMSIKACLCKNGSKSRGGFDDDEEGGCHLCGGKGFLELRLERPTTGPNLFTYMNAWAKSTEQGKSVLESLHRLGEIRNKTPEKQSPSDGIILQLQELDIDIPPDKQDAVRLLLAQQSPSKKDKGGWRSKKKETGPTGAKAVEEFPIPAEKGFCRFVTSTACALHAPTHIASWKKGFKCRFKHKLTKKEAETKVALLLQREKRTSDTVAMLMEKLEVGGVAGDDDDLIEDAFFEDFVAPCIEVLDEESTEITENPEFIGGIRAVHALEPDKIAELLWFERRLQPKIDTKKDFLYDTCATSSAFVNTDYVVKSTAATTTMVTANGTITTTKKGLAYLPVIGETKFAVSIIPTGGNLLSGYDLKQQYHHEEPGLKNSAKSWINMFTSRHSDQIMWFMVLPKLPTLVLITDLKGQTIWDRRKEREKEGGGTALALQEPEKRVDPKSTSEIAAPASGQAATASTTSRALTTEERLAQLGVRARESVLKVQRLFQMLHCPQKKELEYWIDKQPWGAASPSKEDMRLWSQVFGDSQLEQLAGKSERVRTHRAVPIYRDPTKLRQEHMGVDLLKWRGRWYFISRMFPLRFIQLDGVADRNAGSIIGAFTQHVLAMLAKKIKAPLVQGDNEMKLALTRTASLMSMDFMNTAALQHEAGIENSIKLVKAAGRTDMARLEVEFTHTDEEGKIVEGKFPLSLDVYLLKHAAMALNAAHVRNGVACEISPREYFTGRTYSVKLDGDIPFATLVAIRSAAADSISNTHTQRVKLGLLLGPSGSNVGGFHVWDVITHQVNERQVANQVPMTNLVKRLIYAKALKDEQTDKRLSGTSDEEEDEGDVVHDGDESDEEPDSEDARAIKKHRKKKQQEREKLAELKKSVEDLRSSEETARRNEATQPTIIHRESLQEDFESQLQKRRRARAELLERGQGTSSTLNTALSLQSEMALMTQSEGTSGENPELVSGPTDQEALNSARELVAGLWQHQSGKKGTELLAMAVNKAIVAMGAERVHTALTEEVKSWVKAQVGSPKRYENLTAREKQCILSVLTLCEEKLDAAGNRIKDKARIVANGAIQDKHSYDTDIATLYSGTASEPAVKITMAVGAEKGWRRATYDVKAAFTKGDRFPGSTVVLHLPLMIAKIFVEQRPEWVQFVEDDGSVYLVLEKSIYGLCEASRMWNENIEKELKTMGFKQHQMEKCVFYGSFEGRQCILNLHVDDMGVEGDFEDDEFFHVLKKKLENVYGDGEVKLTLGTKQDFLGMIVDKSKPGQTTLRQTGFINELLKKGLTGPVQGQAKYPADGQLFSSDDSPALEPRRAKVFKSVVMQLNWLASKTRPDLVTAVAALTTKMTTANEGDWKKVEHTLRYLNGTKEKGLVLRPGSRPGVYVYVDANFPNGHEVVQAKGKSRSGYSGHYGGALIFCRSIRQKIVTRSTSESEIVAMDDASSLTLWVSGFLRILGLLLRPVVMYEDNQSTIAMVKNGNCTAERTRHINVKYFWLHDKIKAGEIVLRYVKSENNVADYFTKSITDATLFRRFTEYLMGTDT